MKWRAARIAAASALLLGCDAASVSQHPAEDAGGLPEPAALVPARVSHVVQEDVTIGRYFEFLDSLITQDPDLRSLASAEHVLVRANPWLIERLEETDYYRMKARGLESLDPQAELAFERGDTLWVPSEQQVAALLDTFAATVLDLNIPEFTLRIMEFGTTRHTFPVRVGQNRRRYLAMAGREVDLRTKTGAGTIVRVEKNPTYVNPVDNHRYEATRRDDGVVTGLPRIPFLEPEIDGERHGQLIHPTTNPETLEKAYSNGCVGTGEAAAWRIYYSAPLGVRVNIRYELTTVTATGDSLTLPDIYGLARQEIVPQTDRTFPSSPTASESRNSMGGGCVEA